MEDLMELKGRVMAAHDFLAVMQKIGIYFSAKDITDAVCSILGFEDLIESEEK